MLLAACGLLVHAAAASAGSALPRDTLGPSTQAVPPAEGVDPGHWRLSAVPRLSYTDDEGIGLGVRGTAFWYRHGARPYKTALSFQAFATSEGVHQHFVRVDAIDAFGLPLRLVGEAGYYQTINFHYCLDEGRDLCALALATPAAADRPAAGNADGAAVSDPKAEPAHFFEARFVQPYAALTGRWRLGTRPHQPELFGGVRVHYAIAGEWQDRDGDGQSDLFPYPDSLYARRFPRGESGFSSVVQLGASLDDRDHEPDPTRGYFLQAALRASHPVLGSAWHYAGAHLGARLYAPLTPSGSLRLASHAFVDAIAGDAPTFELARIGGLNESFAIGGPDIGRGIRQQRFWGEAKAAWQSELRARVGELRVWNEHFAYCLAAFVDAGLSLDRLADLGSTLPRFQVGYGVGLRTTWNENFVMRLDVAFSAAEHHRAFWYSRPDHPF